jgi:hypothetical protein
MPTRPPTHRGPGWRPPEVRKHEYELQRGSSSSRGYGADWKRFRLLYLQAHPLCEDCTQRHHITAATEVHHIHKPRDRPELRLDPGKRQGAVRVLPQHQDGSGRMTGHP